MKNDKFSDRELKFSVIVHRSKFLRSKINCNFVNMINRAKQSETQNLKKKMIKKNKNENAK